MKIIQIISLHGVFIFSCLSAVPTMHPLAQHAGEIAATTLVEGAKSLLTTTNAATLPMAKTIAENVGINAGANFGLNTVMYLDASLKAAVASPAATVVVTVVVIAGVSYVVYKIYRHNYPTLEVRVLKEEAKAKLIENKIRTCDAKIALIKKEREVHMLQAKL